MSNLTTSTSGNITLIDDPNLCILQTCDLSLSSYTYIPNLAANALYLAIFAVYFLAQLYLGLRKKTWGFMIAMLSGLALEIIGYVGRVQIWQNPFNNNAFLINLICLTIAPAFLTAAIYLCLARIVTIYGASLSRFKPRTYTIIFCGCDLVSLVLQGLGGGIAATAKSISGKNTGKDIMLAGLAFQVLSLLLFAALCAEFGWRVRKGVGHWNMKFAQVQQSGRFQGFLWGLGLATLTILIRCIFRLYELSGGFNGTAFNNQITFMVLEGAMIIIACLTLTILHPGIGFLGSWTEANFVFRTWTKARRAAVDKDASSSRDDGAVSV